MKIPVKITPDNLKHAILNIRFTPIYPIEFFYGHVHELLKSDFNYVPLSPPIKEPIANQNQLSLVGIPNAIGVFHNEKIKFQILGTGNLVFSNWDKYLGWNVYFNEIKIILNKINSSSLISSYRSIGLRYISEYINESIFDKIQISFPVSIRDRTTVFKGSIFKTEIVEGNRKIVLNIADKIERINQSESSLTGTEQFSLIDIDTIIPINIKNIDDLEKYIEEAHSIEKEIFFGILKEDFIASLQPIYE